MRGFLVLRGFKWQFGTTIDTLGKLILGAKLFQDIFFKVIKCTWGHQLIIKLSWNGGPLSLKKGRFFQSCPIKFIP